jgi:hypothetical protein
MVLPNSTKSVSFNWTPHSYGEHVLKIVADSGSNVLELNETNNNNSVTVDVQIEKMKLYNTELIPSSSDPNGYCAATYYYEAKERICLIQVLGPQLLLLKLLILYSVILGSKLGILMVLFGYLFPIHQTDHGH